MASGRDTSAILRGLKPVTSYHIRMMAENGIGWSEPSQAVHITTAEEGKYFFSINIFIYLCSVYLIVKISS